MDLCKDLQSKEMRGVSWRRGKEHSMHACMIGLNKEVVIPCSKSNCLKWPELENIHLGFLPNLLSQCQAHLKVVAMATTPFW